MDIRAFVLLLIASLACAQVSQPSVRPSSENPSATNVSAPEVKPDDPVITINGFCPSQTQPDDQCKTVITRAQFEKLAEALQPDMPLPLRLKVADSYARFMRMADAAEKRGLDKTPAFEEEMRFARMQLLSQDLDHALRADANAISEADLEDYYKKHEPSFEEATVARIFVPHAKQIAADDDEHADASQPGGERKTDNAETKKAAAAAMTKVAADLRARAMNGENPDKLQIEAYTIAGIPGTSPNTKMQKVRRDTLPPSHERVMEMKPGEVSEVFSDPGGAHFIYKMISKETLSVEDVKSEIREQISNQRYRESMKLFQGDVVFNDAYFRPPAQSAPAQHPHRKARKIETPAQSAKDQN